MERTRYILAGWLIDGSSGPAQKRMLLTIVNGRFASIDRYEKENAPDPALVTDLSHCTIVPPLVDCHVHLASSPSVKLDGEQLPLTGSYAEIKPRIARHLQDNFFYGVFAVRDAGDHFGHVLHYKMDSDAGFNEPVIVKTAGRGWHQKGLYGNLIGRFPDRGKTLSSAFAKEDEPIDQVKIIHSGPVSLRSFGRETPPQFDPAELEKIVRLAREKGKKVMVHANGSIPVRQAVEAGCHSIEHGFFMGRDNMELMAEKGTTWVPTAVMMKSCLEDINKKYRPAGDPAVVKKNLQHQLEQISMARECGVTVALGTDAGRPGILHGESMVEEMRLLMKGGYSLPEAIRCGSYNGAQLLGIEKDSGLISRGRPSHFIAARGTPSQLPRKLSYLEAIYLNGKPVQ